MRTLIITFILALTFCHSYADGTNQQIARDWHLVDNSVIVTGTLSMVKEGIAIIQSNEGQWTLEINKLHWKDRKYIINVLPTLQASSGFTAKDATNLVFRLLALLLLVTVGTISMITTGDSGIRVSTVLFISTMLLCIVFTSCGSVKADARPENNLMRQLINPETNTAIPMTPPEQQYRSPLIAHQAAQAWHN